MWGRYLYAPERSDLRNTGLDICIYISPSAWLVRIRRRARHEYCLSGYIRWLRVWLDAWHGDGVINWADVAVRLQLMKPVADGHRQERNL